MRAARRGLLRAGRRLAAAIGVMLTGGSLNDLWDRAAGLGDPINSLDRDHVPIDHVHHPVAANR